MSGEKAATTRERGAADGDGAGRRPGSPVIAAQFADAERGGRRDAERGEAHRASGAATATSTPAHVPHARPDAGARDREAVLAERVAERGTEQQGQQRPGDAGGPGSGEEVPWAR